MHTIVTMGRADASAPDGVRRTLRKPLSLDLLVRVVEEFCAPS
jgi:hypothetical protein